MFVSPIGATLHLDHVARDFVSWLTGWLGETSTIDWVLLAAALAIAYFLRTSVVALTRLGPVEVELLECDDKADVHALTASLRERLAKSGLPAPVVPSGAPKVSVVAAIAASPLPEGEFIAKVLEALPIPQPPQYKLSGTVFEREKTPGISFWLRPDHGQPLIRTKMGRPHAGAGGYEGVVKSTAFDVYSFISTQAVQAFPTWARWHSADALDDYGDGSVAARDGQFTDARASLTKAQESEPDNALVRLQLANVYERLATDDPVGPPKRAPTVLERETKAKEQAEALRRYLSIADEWAWLVQARYRASVLAGVLAQSCATDEHARTGTIKGLGLQHAANEEVTAIVERIAKSEADFVLQLLKPWYMIVRWRRLRSQFEPSAEERRQLKRAVGISRHCQYLRSLNPEKKSISIWFRLRYGEVAVQCWHLFFGLIRVDWQTHYVAACFDALLLERAKVRDRGATDE
jgi:hypothetical protein